MNSAALKETATTSVRSPKRGIATISKPPPYVGRDQIESRNWTKAESVSPGSVLIKKGTPIPSSVGFDCRQFQDWQLVTGLDSFEISKKLSRAGWYLSFIVPAQRAFAIGRSPAKALERALRRLMGRVEAQSFNAIEITRVELKQVLGIRWARVSGHPRHLRNSPFLRNLNRYSRMHAGDLRGIYHSVNRRASWKAL